jgi:predicted nucleic acid-binding protein
VILVDTSVWVDHFRVGVADLVSALNDGEILMHPFVLGELACGNFRKRSHALALLRELPLAREATHDEVMAMIDERRLMGRGIGYVDAHLLAAVAITPEARLWTRDASLSRLAASLGLA